MIEFEDFAKLDMRVGKVIEVEEVESSNKLFKLTVDVGEEKRTVMAGLKGYYTRDELLNKTVVILLNLRPKKIFGVESEGMLLAADDGSNVRLLTPDGSVEIGARIR